MPSTFEPLLIFKKHSLDAQVCLASLNVKSNLAPEEEAAIKMLYKFIEESSVYHIVSLHSMGWSVFILFVAVNLTTSST